MNPELQFDNDPLNENGDEHTKTNNNFGNVWSKEEMIDDFYYRDMPENFVDNFKLKEFYDKIFDKIRKLEIDIENIEKSMFNAIKEWNVFLPILKQFIIIGFCKATEIKELIEVFSNFLIKIYYSYPHLIRDENNKIITYEPLKNDKFQNFIVGDTKDYFIKTHEFFVNFGKICSLVNIFRTHLISSIILKYFDSIVIKKEISYLTITDFFSSFNKLIQIFSLDGRKQINYESIRIESFQILNYNLSQIPESEDHYLSSTSFKQIINDNCQLLIPEIDIPVLNIMNDVIIDMLNKRANNFQIKKNVSMTVKYFNEIYFLKKLKKIQHQINESYYLRSLKIIPFLKKIQLSLNNDFLIRFAKEIEINPEVVNYFIYNIRKYNDINKLIEKIPDLIYLLKNINQKLRDEYLNKIYFRKMQKMIEMSKLELIFLEIFNKIYMYVNKLERSTQSFVNSDLSINNEIYDLFLETKQFFILMMRKNNFNVLKKSEEIKDKCLDVLMLYGFECDDLIKEIHLYLNFESIFEDIRNIFIYAEENVIIGSINLIIEKKIDEFEEKMPKILVSCKLIKQCINILIELTQFPNLPQQKNFKSDILNKLLQSNFGQAVLNKDFLGNLARQVKKLLPPNKGLITNTKPEVSALNPETTNLFKKMHSLNQKNVKIDQIIELIFNLQKNIYILYSSCLYESTFSKMIFKSQNKMSEINDLLQSKRMPLALKNNFYRFLFDCYFSIGNFRPTNIIFLIKNILIPEIENIIKFCKAKMMKGSLRMDVNILKIVKNIRRNTVALDEEEEQNQEEFEDVNISKDSINLENVNLGEEEDMMEKEINVEEYSEEEPAQDDENLINDEPEDYLDLSQNYKVFDEENLTLNTIWFNENELSSFLNEKKGNRFDGFLTFLSDLSVYILFRLNYLKSTFQKHSELIKEFLLIWEDLRKCFPQFEKAFTVEEIQHVNLLTEVVAINFNIIWEDCQKNNKDVDESFTHSFIGNVRDSLRTRKRENQTKTISDIRLKPQLNKIDELDENEEIKTEAIENIPSNTHIEGTATNEIDNERIMNLIRYSLLTLKVSFSEWIKEIFDADLVNMEKKLIDSFIRLIETAQSKKFNYLITFENIENELDLRAEHIPLFIKSIRSNLFSDEVKMIKDDEMIKIMIEIDKAIYSTKNHFTNDKRLNENVFTRVISYTNPTSLTFLENFNRRLTSNEDEIQNFLKNQTIYTNFLTFCELNMLKLSREMQAKSLITIDLTGYFKTSLNEYQIMFKNKKIEKCLSNKNSRFVFIHSLKQYVINQIKTQPELIHDFQIEMNSKFITLFCMKMIVSEKENNVIAYECFEIMFLLLLNGNFAVQSSLYQVITENFEYFNIVEKIQNFLNQTFKKIDEQINDIVPNFKWEGEENFESRSIRKYIKMDYFRFAITCFKFLQILNENCFQDFQNMFREQNFFDFQSKNNLIQLVIDHLIQIAQYIRLGEENIEDLDSNQKVKNKKNLKQLFKSQGFDKIINKKKESSKKQEVKGIPDEIENKDLKLIILYGLDYLNDAMMGPNEKNQTLILINSGLIDIVFSIIENVYLPEIIDIDNPEGITKNNEIDFFLFEKAVKMLLIATNGNLKKTDYNYIFNEEHIKLLNFKSEEIYTKIISENRQKLYSGSFTSYRDSIFPQISENKKSLFEIYKLTEDLEKKKTQTEEGVEILYSKSMLFKIVQSGHDLFILSKRAEDISNQKSAFLKNDFYLFYSKFYGQIEVNVNDKIRIARFTKPYLTYFHYDSSNLINDFEMEPHKEKIKNFVFRNEMYQESLEIRRFQYKYVRPIYYLTKNKTLFEYFFFLILLVINFILIINSKHTFDGDLNVSDLDLSRGVYYFDDHIDFSRSILIVLGIFNSIQAFLIFFVYLFESLPSSRHYWKNIYEEITEELNAIKKESKGLKKQYLKFISIMTNNESTLIAYWFNFKNIYNFLIIILSITSIFIPFFYPFLLLDIIQRSPTLRNIVKSVTNNWSQLTLTLILTLIVMYCYAMISFTFFPDHYEHSLDGDFQNYCHTLSHCFATVVNNGLRAGGGLGEAIGQPMLDDTRYKLRYWVDLSFMIIILIVLLNIVFGIIIDTFGDMRAEKSERVNYIKTNCMVCDMTKAEIDADAEGYYKHITSSHSITDYVHFFIFIKKKNINDCDGIEQSVKKDFENDNFNFMPNQTCYSLENFD